MVVLKIASKFGKDLLPAGAGKTLQHLIKASSLGWWFCSYKMEMEHLGAAAPEGEAQPSQRGKQGNPTKSPGALQEQWIRLDQPGPGAAHGRYHHKLQGIELRQAGHLFRTATALCRSRLGSQGRSQQLWAPAGGSIQVPPAIASQHRRASPLQMDRGP